MSEKESNLDFYKRLLKEEDIPEGLAKSLKWTISLLETFPISCENIYCGISVPPGWRDIVWDAIQKIEDIALRDDIKPRVAQIKEKFGGLRLYVDNTNKEIEDLIDAVESKSYYVCEKCNEAGLVRRDLGWHQTLCETHYQNKKNYINARNYSKKNK